MTGKWHCRSCRLLLGKGHDEGLHLKNKAEETVVVGEDFVVTKICRRCGTTNELRLRKRR